MTNSLSHSDVTADNNRVQSHIWQNQVFMFGVSLHPKLWQSESLFGYLDRMCSHYSYGFHWLGVDYIQYITLKEHAQENDEDNSERHSFVWLLNERKRNKDRS